GSEPPMAKPVMLAFEQMVQRQRLRGPVDAGAVGSKPAFDHVSCAWDLSQLRLEGRRLLAIGMAQSGVAGGECEHPRAGLAILAARFLDDHTQHFAITFRRDRQAML